MEHARHELDCRRLVRILLGEFQGQLECPILPRGVLRPARTARGWSLFAHLGGVPRLADFLERSGGAPKDDGVPHHDVIVERSAVDALGRVGLHALEVAH